MASSTTETELPKMVYKNLGSSGLKVSQVIAGTMSYGTPDWQVSGKWKDGWAGWKNHCNCSTLLYLG